MNASIKNRTIFPLSNHPLYGDAATLQDCSFLLPAKLAEFTSDCRIQNDGLELEVCASCFFQSSGTSSRPKKVPYSEADLQRQREHEALAFSKIGMKASDYVVSLGAAPPSISAWAIENGSRQLGAQVLNTSQLDYETAIESPDAHKATVVFGTPIVMREIGREIRDSFGSVSAVFPKLRVGILFGDVLPAPLREEIRELWGFEAVRSLYGTVEADVVATESVQRPGELELMHECLTFEFICASELQRERSTPGYTPKAIPMNQTTHGQRGEIVISDTRREVLPLLRYRIGDAIEIVRNDNCPVSTPPNIRVLGRTKNIVSFHGVPMYEMQINDALLREVPQAQDWSWHQKDEKEVTVKLLDVQIDEHEALAKVRSAISSAMNLPSSELPMDCIAVDLCSSAGKSPVSGDVKSSRIYRASLA